MQAGSPTDTLTSSSSSQNLLEDVPSEGTAVSREEAFRLLVDNQLGVPLFASTAKDGFTTVLPVPTSLTSTVPLPPLQFPDMLRDASSMHNRQRRFLAVRVINAQVRAVGIRGK